MSICQNLTSLSKIKVRRLIYKSYQMSFNSINKFLLLGSLFASVGLLVGWYVDVLYKEGFVWLLPSVSATSEIIVISLIKVVLFSLFIICWARIISKKTLNFDVKQYLKVFTFVVIWLVWHYVSFLAIYNIYFAKFSLIDLLVIVAGGYLPFVWVRFYSLLARLLNNEEISGLSEFLRLTQGQVIKICIALLFVVVPCSATSWLFAEYFRGNIMIGEFVLNFILLFFTTVWINHCFTQNKMLQKTV